MEYNCILLSRHAQEFIFRAKSPVNRTLFELEAPSSTCEHALSIGANAERVKT